MRALIIEDDSYVSESLRRSLESECFAVDTVADGEDGSYIARTNEYDLIIVDLILPKKSGMDICREARAAGKMVPIIVISIRTHPTHKISLLDAGADDFLSKPFSYEELTARIRAVLRRPHVLTNPLLSVGSITLNSDTHIVTKNEKDVYLTRKEFSLLEYLLKNKNNVVSRSMIMEHVWNSESDPFSNTIEAHILNLRKKIDNDKTEKYIYNVPGRGYKICDPYNGY